MPRPGIDWVYDRGNKSGRPVTKPSTGIRPDNVRSMVYTRPGSHHPQPVTYSDWERENVKNSSDRYSTGWPPVTHSYWEREKMKWCLATGDQPVEVGRSTGRFTYRACLRPVEPILPLFLLWKNWCFVCNYW